MMSAIKEIGLRFRSREAKHDVWWLPFLESFATEKQPPNFSRRSACSRSTPSASGQNCRFPTKTSIAMGSPTVCVSILLSMIATA